MWNSISKLILRNRILILSVLLGITALMGYRASKIELSYELARVLPLGDQAHKDYMRFKQMFGEDGNVLVVGVKNPGMFRKEVYNDWYELGKRIQVLKGIKEVLSIGGFYELSTDSTGKTLQFTHTPEHRAFSQAEADSLRKLIYSRPFYKGIILNDSDATLMAVTFDRINLNSANRIAVVKTIKTLCEKFSKTHNIEVHYSGMPFIRTEFMTKVADEMKLFLILAFFVTTSILFIFFRSHLAVLFSSVVVFIGVIWSLGTIELLGYKITLLSGLIPPLIMIIGVPNCIFLLNKYHSELKIHGNKAKALSRAIEKIGISLLLANITTAIGFGVFYFTNSDLLKEFGVVAAINVTATYFVSLVFIPIVFSYLRVPKLQHDKHMHSVRINRVLEMVVHLVHHHRRKIYLVVTVLTVISLAGMTRANIKGYLVDDLPKNHPVYHDLRFFESNFNGVLPFEVLIDTKAPNGLYANSAAALYKMNALQKLFASYKEFSKPISLVETTKYLYQSYRGGEPRFYRLPGAMQLKELSDNVKPGNTSSGLSIFADSTARIGRISYQMADVGSIRMKEIVSELRAKTDSLFKDTGYDVIFTGYSIVFLKSNDYLLGNLFESLLIAIVLITLVGLALFRSLRIIILSKIPCLIPLVFTAGIMGYFNIYFKPSTILIFSIAFGIASDGTIYFLTKFRQELMRGLSISESISVTIRETGVSMIYTAVILFFGFGIFVFSGFGGTVALGILISTTILMSVCTNMVLLPAFLLSISKYIRKKDFQKQLVKIDYEE
jgi:uncharacterized protein